jgi:hypothetical protein
MLFFQQPPDTSAYMIAGYVVIFGTMILYVLSLALRRRNLEQDMQTLQDLEQSEAESEAKKFSSPVEGSSSPR